VLRFPLRAAHFNSSSRVNRVSMLGNKDFAVHRIMHRPVRLCGPGSEFPLSRSLRFGPTLLSRSPCTARLGSYRRRSSELPRPFSLSAVPAHGPSGRPDSRMPQLGSPQIARLPRLSASCLAADEGSGCPAPCIVWLYRRRIFELPRISRPSAVLSVTPQVAPARPCSSLCR